MDQGLIPRRYAKALFEVGAERSDNDTLYILMRRLADAFASTSGMAATVANPFVSNADKTALLTAAVYGTASDKPDATYEDFLKLLEQNGRTDMARDIALAFIDLYRKKNDIFSVSICSAAPMSADLKERLEALIRQHVGKGTVEYNYTVDPALIGGFTVTVNSERLDASVSSELKKLRLSLLS